MGQWLTEATVISVSGVLLGPMTYMPYTDFKGTILHQISLAKQPPRTEQTDKELHCEEPLSLSHVNAMNTEMLHAEDLEDIPKQPNTYINSAVAEHHHL